MALADRLREQALAPVRVVAVAAGEVHLPAALMVRGAAGLEVRARGAFDADGDRHAARLAREVGREREQLIGLVAQGAGTHALGAAPVDAALEIEEFSASRIDARVARRDPAHVYFLVAACAGKAFFSRRLAPQLLPALHPQHAGVGELVGLQRSQVLTEERRARFELIERDGALLRLRAQRECRRKEQRGAAAPHPLTAIGCRSEPCTPSSSTQVNSRLPLASATV